MTAADKKKFVDKANKACALHKASRMQKLCARGILDAPAHQVPLSLVYGRSSVN